MRTELTTIGRYKTKRRRMEIIKAPELNYLVRMLVKVARASRAVPIPKVKESIAQLKEYISAQSLRSINDYALNEVCALSSVIAASNPQNPHSLNSVPPLVQSVCTTYNKVVGDFLELPPYKIHCSIKLFINKQQVRTWTRSIPTDGRSRNDSESVPRRLSENTVWTALLGGSDDKRTWGQYKCFSCGDLTKVASQFSSDRLDWARYYKAKLVFPLDQSEWNNSSSDIFGFLAFDSPDAYAFRKLPDIFSYKESDQWPAYHAALTRCPVYHLGNILARLLSQTLHPYFVVVNGIFEQEQTRASVKGLDDHTG